MAEPEHTPADEVAGADELPPLTPFEQVRPRAWGWFGPAGEIGGS
ncbi:hypothetical protein [Gryllotalpicola ginsengisoli]|nr:hypothetical protein [Gryllotalpicola ginsengisoli]